MENDNIELITASPIQPNGYECTIKNNTNY